MDQTTFKKLKYLIEPCQSADELNNYIIDHWNIVLPWDIVDERSTSSSLKFMWGVYKTMLYGGINRHVLAASRNSSKTLCSSMIQYFSMLHFRRDGVQIAALLDHILGIHGADGQCHLRVQSDLAFSGGLFELEVDSILPGS
jgi:hypothetical protein